MNKYSRVAIQLLFNYLTYLLIPNAFFLRYFHLFSCLKCWNVRITELGAFRFKNPALLSRSSFLGRGFLSSLISIKISQRLPRSRFFFLYSRSFLNIRQSFRSKTKNYFSTLQLSEIKLQPYSFISTPAASFKTQFTFQNTSLKLKLHAANYQRSYTRPFSFNLNLNYNIHSILKGNFLLTNIHIFVNPLQLKSVSGRFNFIYFSKFITAIVQPHLQSLIQASTFLTVDFFFIRRLDPFSLNLLDTIKLNLMYLRTIFANVLFTSELVDLIYYVMASRDTESFITYIRRIFRKLSIWDHRRLTIILCNILLNQFNLLLTKLGIIGFLFKIKGKLGVTGNARKRITCVKWGKISTSRAATSAAFSNSTISTSTGVLGVTFLLISASETTLN